MLVLVGHSASGKTEIAKALTSRYQLKKIATHTTRKIRNHEVNGVDYHFHSEEEFLALAAKNYFIETTYFNGSYYGTAREDVRDDRVLIIDPVGLDSFKKLGIDNIFAVFLKTDRNIRFERMLNRGDDKEAILKRLEHDLEKFSWNNLRNIDWVVDANILSISYLTDLIYNQYVKVLDEENE